MKVEYVNHYLTDKDVANFARQSFDRLASEFTAEQNDSLVRFLARGMKSKDWETLLQEIVSCGDTNKAKQLATYLRSIPEHWVPFGHPHISVTVSAPVPIARQLFKHKIGLTESETSRRYISSEPSFYIPTTFRENAKDVKQGSGGTHPNSDYFKGVYTQTCEKAAESYKEMITNEVCPEQARFILPQGMEVNWTWTGSLYAFANVYNQRIDSHAQVEVQEIAKMLHKIIYPLYPVSWSALTAGNY